ncbi:MAG: energy-coupling factor transporter transmembrane component T [Lachnospiraceae bacterium]
MISKTKEENNFSTYHPLVIFSYYTVVILIVMFSNNPIFLALSFGIGFYYSVRLGGEKAIKRNIMYLIPILILMAIINPLFNHRGVTVLFYLNDNAITAEAIIYGVASASMLVSAIMWFGCFSHTLTSDKIIYLFGRIIPSISLVLAMCFRFIPLLQNRYREIHEGQKCMGRDMGTMGLMARLRQLAKEVSILIAWSLEASIETSDSMEARGYGLRGRTSFHMYRFTKRDGWAMGFILLLAFLILWACMLGVNDIYYYPALIYPGSTKMLTMAGITYGILLLFPAALDIEGERKWKKLNLEM